MGMNTRTRFYKDKPLFGLDIGFNTIKVMQLTKQGKGHVVDGYGVAKFDPKAVKDGVIIDYEHVAKSVHDLFKKGLVGEITTRRVAFSVPAARTFSRILTLPKIPQKDMKDAVMLEAEQYIPVPLADLYIDYIVTRQTDKNIDVMAVAVPRKVVDSYLVLAKMLGLEVVVMETTIGATGRLFTYTDEHNVPTVLIDFGSISADITIFDQAIMVTGTVLGGGDDITNLISEKLKVTKEEAHIIKVKYGLSYSKKQKEIIESLNPMLQKLVKEVKRMIRYYEERSEGHHKVQQVVSFGGGSNVPGLSEYLTDNLRVPVRACDPWNHLMFKRVEPPSLVERSMYITVAGLALINPREIFS